MSHYRLQSTINSHPLPDGVLATRTGTRLAMNRSGTRLASYGAVAIVLPTEDFRMLLPSTTRTVQIADGHSDPAILVSANAIRDLNPERLTEIESAWMPARHQAARTLAPGNHGSEHGHWDWRNKVRSAELGRHRLVAIECRDEIQGLMALLSEHRLASLGHQGSPSLYIDYLEAAPWNLKRNPSRPRFLGVGTLLVAEAVRISVELGWQGRVGLHSLPQAERFDELNCRMTALGRDPNYYDLPYFEYTAEQAAQWLVSVGGST